MSGINYRCWWCGFANAARRERHGAEGEARTQYVVQEILASNIPLTSQTRHRDTHTAQKEVLTLTASAQIQSVPQLDLSSLQHSLSLDPLSTHHNEAKGYKGGRLVCVRVLGAFRDATTPPWHACFITAGQCHEPDIRPSVLGVPRRPTQAL